MYPITYENIIYELCKKNHIKIEKMEPESIYRLTKENATHFIWSRRFDINTTISCRIADNKFATYSVLKSLCIPVVPCTKLPRIDTEDYSNSPTGIMEICFNLLNQYGTIVIKPNNSCEGTDVFKCNNLKSVETTLMQIERKYKYLIVSPFINANAEYRLFFLDNDILFAYKKEQNYVECDGISTIKKLLLDNNICLSNISPDVISEFEKIYPQNYKFQLNWKFNLSKGANCLPITDLTLYKELIPLAISAAKAINIRFATVDILVDRHGNKQILEINAGVAMDQFIIKYPKGREIAASIYEKALIAMFS